MPQNNSENYLGTGLLSDIDKNLPNYNRHIFQLMWTKLNIPINEQTKIMDFGAGGGTLPRIWQSELGVKPICVELDPNLRDILVQSGFPTYEALSEVQENFRIIYSSNVLEHISNDHEILLELGSKLEKDGWLVLYVPAFSLLFSNLDRLVGHFRRYNKKELFSKIERSHLKVVNFQYSDSVGFFLTLFLKLINFDFKQKPTSNVLMRAYDRIILPLSIALDNFGFKRFLGKNIIVVAKKF